ncbi:MULTISPECIES: DsbE family thiol:disulfide interchange protein [Halomonadaceae]|uniref:DsbE family thiol:disulfide interchange protein n=1 Tax=Halomonadaceae TaxID=28256 RepID=UPI0012F275B2|nr:MULTISPECIES: DsbE family thiol:disulfide interchange protein [Halomonas]CAD5268517.1 periplasmic thioredoxin of cytochrome c-type biogenesis [Halomonas sp. I3]CAD5274441.1 periplasmic thioredoxin of cytochrome c-type biogenesis [Halomonas sp. 113]CAD5276070.1 periplasmic thioredoxin of cytochrome c-type biogenesis [Halomonas sp. 59]CAD5277549.1 periplasmic thioredoxin of cytochrome c-type biogenesis [Halomonas sp. 156]VXB96060.1 periplasmic thioredoxin of cytochrome c-type biogenesis [Halo
MKRRLLLLLLPVCFLALALFFYQGLSLDPSQRDSALMAREFPTFEASTLRDENRCVDQTLLKGEVTLVNVWGEWCPACKQEMPQLLELADNDIRMVGVNYRDTREKGMQFLSEFGDPFEVNIFDPEGELGFDLGVYGAPETFLVDADGVIRYHHKGYVSPQDVRERILPEVEKWR